MLNRMVFVTAAGEGTANDRLWHLTGKERSLLLDGPLFLCLHLGNILNLFLHRGEQIELERGRFRRRRGSLYRRRNGGLFARRLFFLLVYL